ncbi:MAG: hypothetical protein JJ863_32625 [Deltaproteobacteria bacterium]|nr:hypothetical protein [Deltaproteobacteria bacterium]
MDSNGQDFGLELGRAIADGHSLAALLELVVDYKDRGIAQEAVAFALQQLRKSAPDEAYEDRVLDVMDFVWGWCHVSRRIWDADLTEERLAAFVARQRGPDAS